MCIKQEKDSYYLSPNHEWQDWPRALRASYLSPASQANFSSATCSWLGDCSLRPERREAARLWPGKR
eukprot:979699-Alexandrium_andersonii.AAC.1